MILDMSQALTLFEASRAPFVSTCFAHEKRHGVSKISYILGVIESFHDSIWPYEDG
jgi:hypothetical protein